VSPFRLCFFSLALSSLIPLSAPAQSSFVALSDSLAQWKKEIEQKSEGKLIPVRVYTDPLRNELVLPEDTPERAVLRRYFLDESFRALFVDAHSLSLNYSGTEGKFHFVLLNMARVDEWGGFEDAVLADEFGHAWLAALDYGTPVFMPGDRSCLHVHASDALQHLLIRHELTRRNIPHLDFWRHSLDLSLRKMKSEAAQPPQSKPPCQRLAQLALLLDVRLSLSPQLWKNFDRFQQLIAKLSPEIMPAAQDLEKRLRQLQPAASSPLPDRKAYQDTLDYLLDKFTELYDAKP
jgi:hypothetical protein